MTSVAMKITRKGQMPLPKEIRERLKSSAVYFEAQDDVIIVKPVRVQRVRCANMPETSAWVGVRLREFS